MMYRPAELAGTGQLDHAESMKLQHGLVDIYWELYAGTVLAVRDHETASDETNPDNTYSDGREVMTQIRIEPEPQQWDGFIVRDGPTLECPREMIIHIADHGRPPAVTALTQTPTAPASNTSRPGWSRMSPGGVILDSAVRPPTSNLAPGRRIGA
jgi:hypothetical protein